MYFRPYLSNVLRSVDISFQSLVLCKHLNEKQSLLDAVCNYGICSIGIRSFNHFLNRTK